MLFAAPKDPPDPFGTALHLVLSVWWLWTLAALVLAGRAAKFVWLQRRLRRAGIHDIDSMDGPTFEKRLGVLFRALGYRVELANSPSAFPV